MEIRVIVSCVLAAAAALPAQFVFGHSHPHAFAAGTGPVAEVLFAASDGPTTPCEGMEVWSVRGNTVARVAAIVPGTTGSYPREIVAAPGGRFFFTADDRVSGRELWTSTGAGGTTALVKDIRVAPNGAGSLPSSLTVVGSSVCFSADDGVLGRELWCSDGTGAGTLAFDLRPGALGSDPHELVAWNGKLYFVADDGNGAGLWVFDPSNSTATPIGPRGTNPSNLTPSGSRLFFAATDATNGRELWASDGTANNTNLLRDLRVGPASSAPDQIRALPGGNVVFTALDDAEGRELWSSSGTPPGTGRRSMINPGTEGGHILELSGSASGAWFQADDGTGPGLWRYTGGVSATKFVLPPGVRAPRDLTPFLGGLVFSAETTANGRELWFATSAATMFEIRPGVDGSTPGFFFVDGGRVLFSAYGPSGIEPYAFTGAAASLLHDIDPKALVQPELHAESASGGAGGGATLTFRYANGAANGLAFTIVSAAPTVPLALPIPGLVGFLRVDLAVALVVGPIPLDGQGRGSVPGIFVPQPAIAAGITVGAQGVVLGSSGTISLTDSLSAGSYEADVGGGQVLAAKIGTYKDDTWEHKIPIESKLPGASGQCYLGLIHHQWDEATGTWTPVLLDTWPYQPLSEDPLSIDGLQDMVPKLGTRGDVLELRYWTEEPSSPVGGQTLFVSYC
jgi:ELWxxDGT repeat protein